MTDPLFISEQAKWPLDSVSTITFTMCCHCLIFYPTPGTPSESELPLQPPIMASQNTSYVSWAAGPPKSTTATSVQISKISDPHNLLSSDWRFWGVRHYTGAVADSLQESPQRTWRTQKNQDLRCFVFYFVINKSFKRISLAVWTLLLNWSLIVEFSGVGPHLNSANFLRFALILCTRGL